MANLRIHLLKYRNRGMANRKLKGQVEYHTIFKWDTEEQAKDFITQVKEFWYSRESVKDKVINVMNDETKKPTKSFDGGISSKDAGEALVVALNESKDEKPEVKTTTKPAPRRRPGPQKGQGGRPRKTNI